MQEDYNVEDVIIIDNRDYCVVKKHKEYYIIVSISTPLDIMVGKIINGEFVIEKNNEIIKKILQ